MDGPCIKFKNTGINEPFYMVLIPSIFVLYSACYARQINHQISPIMKIDATV